MKNYYDQQQELELAISRLNTLKEKKQLYFEETQPKSKKINGVMVQSSIVNHDKFLEYTSKIETIDEDIEILEKEIKMLEKYLKKMEYNLRHMKGALEKIFVDRYIDGLDVRRIAKKNCYSESNIYELLRKIRKIINEKWKFVKNCNK